jgi:hypothetical protein
MGIFFLIFNNMLYRAYINFPKGQYLTLSTFPQSDTPEEDTYISCDTGVDSETGRLFIVETVEMVARKLLASPKAYTLSAVPQPFKHLYYPGGVYRITVIPVQGVAPIDLDPVLNTVYVDFALKKVAELIMVTRCKVCDEELGEVMQLGNAILTLKQSAQIAFNDGEYTQASNFIETAERMVNKVLKCIEEFINAKRKFQF